jgi:hypothetical protein
MVAARCARSGGCDFCWGFPDVLIYLSDNRTELVMWLSHFTDALIDNDFVPG